MRKRILKPEQIIVPGEYELGNESILKIYFRVFDTGYSSCLPPVIVVSSCYITEQERRKIYSEEVRKGLKWLRGFIGERLSPYDVSDSLDNLVKKIEESQKGLYGIKFYKCESVKRELEDYFNRIELFERKIKETDFFLLDGNHRSAAATLTHKPLSALELENDKDLKKIREMVERGGLFDFKRPEISLSELYTKFVGYIIGAHNSYGSHIENLKSVKQRIDELTLNDHLPQYMIKRYKQEQSHLP